jgi:hypothetical protein
MNKASTDSTLKELLFAVILAVIAALFILRYKNAGPGTDLPAFAALVMSCVAFVAAMVAVVQIYRKKRRLER